MRLPQILLAALAAALLAACSQPAATTNPTPATAEQATTTDQQPATTPAAGSAYPGPAASSAYPGPAAAGSGAAAAPTVVVDNTPLVVPQPASAQVGVVTGTLLRITSDNQREPYAGGIVYLGNIVTDGQGRDVFVSVDVTTAPRTTTNGLGQFAFADAQPGRYGLMLQTPQGVVQLHNPDNGGDFIITVTGGQVTDLGSLAYPLP